MDTWYIYSPADTDETGSRLMLNWGLGYEKALALAGLHIRRTGKRTNVADTWHDVNILGRELAEHGLEDVPHRHSADPFDGTEPAGWTPDASIRLARAVGA